MKTTTEDCVTDQATTEEQVTPLTALRRRWKLGVLLTVVGTLVGVLVGAYVVPSTYTAEQRLAVGSNDLSALSIPGYALASSQLAGNVARYVDNAAAIEQLEPVLGDDAAQVEDVTASQIPESNIVRVEVTADTEDVAVRATGAVSQYLIQQAAAVNGDSVDQALQSYTELSRQVAQAQQAVQNAQSAVARSTVTPTPGQDVAALRQAVVDAQTQLETLTAQQDAAQSRYEDVSSAQNSAYALVTVQDPQPSYDTASSNLQRYGLFGFVLGVLLALVLATVLERRRASRSAAAAAPAGDAGVPPADDSAASTRRLRGVSATDGAAGRSAEGATTATSATSRHRR